LQGDAADALTILLVNQSCSAGQSCRCSVYASHVGADIRSAPCSRLLPLQPVSCVGRGNAQHHAWQLGKPGLCSKSAVCYGSFQPFPRTCCQPGSARVLSWLLFQCFEAAPVVANWSC
jgi:hypothetical protein